MSGDEFFGKHTKAMDLAVSSAEKNLKYRILQDSLPWVEKYRPLTLDKLISQEQITQTLNKLIDGGRIPHLLFYGPPGTGKTTSILAVARKLNGENYKNATLELNASDERTIQTVREKVKDFASTKKICVGGHKLVILDEADAITNDAQSALRRIIEKYTKNTRFCLICNHVNKIIPAIHSRCTKFRFGLLNPESIRSRLLEVAQLEGVNLSADGADAILRLSRGDMRRVLNILQTAHMSHPAMVDQDVVYACTGNPHPTDIKNVIDVMLNTDFENCHHVLSNLINVNGYALSDIVTEIYELLTRTNFDKFSKISLFQNLANVEYQLACGCSETLQISSIISAFVMVRELADKAITSA